MSTPNGDGLPSLSTKPPSPLDIKDSKPMTEAVLNKHQSRWIPYKDGSTGLEGYFVPPVGVENAPGILIIHTWLGITESIQQRAQRISQMGYAAFALDLFGPGVLPLPPQKPQEVIRPFYADRHFFRQRLKQGLKILSNQPECQSQNLAAIGYCFGGCAALELARSGEDLKGAVSFHGELDTPLPAKPGEVKAKILVLHGDADPVVPFERVVEFREEMKQAQTQWEMDIYSQAKHSFTGEGAVGNNTPGAGLDPTAEARSWVRMSQFFEEIFKN
ncbi:MAG: dienelactone hydrolase family protein [Cyanobacteria bacterium]|nr:dienelactone hydrolase family protein [Cyanobacteriota bacterium]